MPDEPNKNPNPSTKVGYKKVIQISVWAYKLLYKTNPKYVIMYSIFSVIQNLKNLLYAFIFAKILDVMITLSTTPDATMQKIIPYTAFILLYNLLSLLSGYLARLSWRALDFTFSNLAERELYHKIAALGIQTLEQPEINNKITRARDFLGNILPYFNAIVEFFTSVISTAASFFLILSIYPWMVLILLILNIIRFFYDKKFRKLIYKIIYETTEKRRLARYSSSDLQNPATLQEILINGSFDFFDKKFHNFYAWYIKERLVLQNKFMFLNHLFGFASDFTITIFGYLFIFARLIQHQISVGTVTFQIRVLGNLADSLSNVFSVANDMNESAYRLKDIYELFSAEPMFPDGTYVMPKLSTGPEILFKNVDFHYPNNTKKVIANLNLHIKPGEKVAIVGHNGAGKTTLVKLLARMYQVSDGEVLINGTNVNELKIDSFYRNIGILFQEYNMHPQLSPYENIMVGDPLGKQDEVAIRLAAQSADATQFIEEFPNGFNQLLSEKFKGGIRPSTGQWQKLAIARFFYRNAPLVVFDEPTASIDAISEYNIFNKIYDFFKGKTVLIISHRFSTVRNADRIIVMEHGEIIEEGTHNELMSKDGYYAKAFMLQAKGYANND